MSYAPISKTAISVASNRSLSVQNGVQMWVVERGDPDRTIDPNDVEATETLVPVFSDQAGAVPATQPLLSDADGKFRYYTYGSVDLYMPADPVHPIEPWEAQVAFDTAAISVITEAPVRADDPLYAGDLQPAVDRVNTALSGSRPSLYVCGNRDYTPLTADLEITHDKVTIWGDDKSSIIENDADRGTFFKLNGAQDCTIKNLNLICNGEPAAGEPAFIVDDSQDLKVFEIDIDNAPSVVRLGLDARSQRSRWKGIHASLRPEADDDWWQIHDSAEMRIEDSHCTANSGVCRQGSAILLYPGLTGRSTASVDPFKLSVAQMWAHSTGEVQWVAHDATVTGMTITYDGQTTGNVAGMTAAQVKTALEALSNIAPGDVATTGGPMGTARVEVAFQGALAGNTERLEATQTAGTGYVYAYESGRSHGISWKSEGWSTNNQYISQFECDDTTISAFRYRGDSTLDQSRNFWIGPIRAATKAGRIFDFQHVGGGSERMQGVRAWGHWTYGSGSKADEAFLFDGEIDGLVLGGSGSLLSERNYTPGTDYVGSFGCDGFEIRGMAMSAFDDGDTLASDKVWRTTADVEGFHVHNNTGPNPVSGTYFEHYAYASDKKNRIVKDNGGQKVVEQITAAATLPIIPCVDRYVITGATTITDIPDGYSGREITLRFGSTATLQANANLLIDGDLVGAAGRVITLRSNGSEWYEMSRSPRAGGTYKLVHYQTGRCDTTNAATGPFVLMAGASNVASPFNVTTAGNSQRWLFQLVAAELDGNRLRLSAGAFVGSTAPARTYTFGLYPITLSGNNATMGTVVSGTTATLTTPSSGDLREITPVQFSLPSDGKYTIGYVVDSATNPLGNIDLIGRLETVRV